MGLDRPDIRLDHLPRPVHAKLREQEGKLAALRREDLVLRIQIPQLPLERPDRLLAGRVDELLVGLVGLALVSRVLEAPFADPFVELLRERRVFVQEVLEPCREVDLRRLDSREVMEQLVRQCRRTMLHGAGKAVRASDLAELAQHIEIELDLGHAAVRQRDPAMARARLDTHLREADRAGRAPLKLGVVAIEVRAQVLHRRVLVTDLADLTADAHGDPVALDRSDERGELRGARVVLVLLGVDGRLRQVDERRGVDIDVVIAGVDGEAARLADLLGHRLRVGGVFLGVELVVVTLDEHRPPPVRGDRAGEHGRREVDRALEGVGLLAPSDLEDDRADIRAPGGLEDGPGHVERLRTEVDGRHREPVDLATPTRHVQLVDAGRERTQLLARLPDQPLRRRLGRIVLGEHRGPCQIAAGDVAEGLLVIDDEAPAVKVGGAADRRHEIGGAGRDVGHRRDSPRWVRSRPMVATRALVARQRLVADALGTPRPCVPCTNHRMVDRRAPSFDRSCTPCKGG